MKKFIISLVPAPDQQLCIVEGKFVFAADRPGDMMFFDSAEDAMSFAFSNLPLERPEEQFTEFYKIETVFGVSSKKPI